VKVSEVVFCGIHIDEYIPPEKPLVSYLVNGLPI